MIDYEVGTIPSRPLTLMVRDERDNPINIMSYTSWDLEMRGSNDEKVDLEGVLVENVEQVPGVFAVTWPRDRSIFNEKGKYLLRLRLNTPDGGRDITRTAEIRVRDFGRIK